MDFWVQPPEAPTRVPSLRLGALVVPVDEREHGSAQHGTLTGWTCSTP